MNTLEVRGSIDKMSDAERSFATAYLKHLARVNDPTHRAELGTRMRRMDDGKKISLETVKRLHRNLEIAGL